MEQGLINGQIAMAEMEQSNNGLWGMCATLLGYGGTVLGAFWNATDLQLVAFLFTAFAGFGTGTYYLVKAFKELFKK